MDPQRISQGQRDAAKFIGESRPVPADEVPIDKQSALTASAARVARDRSIRRKVVEQLGSGSPGNADHMAETERRAERAREEAMRRFREGR